VLSRRLLDETRRLGVEVHVWTVNDPRRMRELVERGVSGIITDRTDLALDALG
jgi:glycerophosphoryl diester phosphodiesterase